MALEVTTHTTRRGRGASIPREGRNNINMTLCPHAIVVPISCCHNSIDDDIVLYNIKYNIIIIMTRMIVLL